MFAKTNILHFVALTNLWFPSQRNNCQTCPCSWPRTCNSQHSYLWPWWCASQMCGSAKGGNVGIGTVAPFACSVVLTNSWMAIGGWGELPSRTVPWWIGQRSLSTVSASLFCWPDPSIFPWTTWWWVCGADLWPPPWQRRWCLHLWTQKVQGFLSIWIFLLTPIRCAVTHPQGQWHFEVSLSAGWTVVGCQWACPGPLGPGHLPETTLLSWEKQIHDPQISNAIV